VIGFSYCVFFPPKGKLTLLKWDFAENYKILNMKGTEKEKKEAECIIDLESSYSLIACS